MQIEFWERYKNTKRISWSRIAKKDRQYNDQKKKDERTNNNLQETTETKLKIEQNERQ